MAYYLFKSEPEDYSLADLARDRTVRWDGIRNYGARNRLRTCKPGDLVLFYHSGRNAGVVGLAQVTTEPYADPTQFDEESPYFDAKSTPEEPRWSTVDVEHVETFVSAVLLKTMKATPELSELEVLQRQRLSVSVVGPQEFDWIVAAGRTEDGAVK